MFEVRGAIAPFVSAVRRVPGLELVDEEELAGDEGDESPVAYLMIPDSRALGELLSMWRRWQSQKKFARGDTPWRDVFNLLRDLRPWGPLDRVQPGDTDVLAQEVFERADDDLVRLEVELVFRANDATGLRQERDVAEAIAAKDGRVISRARIEEISYHALLADIPVRAVKKIIAHDIDGIAGLEPVMHIRPQSTASSIEVAENNVVEASGIPMGTGAPILALLDGVPIAGHVLLESHVVVDDFLDLANNAPVSARAHGTAMASLIVHGDRNRPEEPLPRKIHVVPVLGAGDRFLDHRLIVDVIYTSILRMVEGPQATASNVLIVNLSLGNSRRPFYQTLSPWARMLDRLAYRYGLLFVVSAGNHGADFPIRAYSTTSAFESASPRDRFIETLRALGQIIADRKLLSPAETVNGVSVGASNEDRVNPGDRIGARVNVDPYGETPMANPSSALGPGFASSVKPEILLPGGREHLRFVRNSGHIEVKPAAASRSAGVRVAAPPREGRENLDGFTSGTSASAALASRTAHQIHDALERIYGDQFLSLPRIQRAVVLKALLVHPAKWNAETAALIRSTLGPADAKQHIRQKDNIRRFIGFGHVDSEDAVACASDRATFWATGTISGDSITTVAIPVPVAIAGRAQPHALSATLAWFTPVAPGRRSYRSVRLKLLNPQNLTALAVDAHRDQPDANQTNRGTVFSRCWSGDRSPVVNANMEVVLSIQRDPDQGVPIDEAVPYGLAVTLTMPGVLEIYDEVRLRLGIAPRASV